MYIAMNRFRVRPDSEEAFRKKWLDRDVLLRTVPGFVSFQFLRGPAMEDYVLYASHTVWASYDAFIGWTRSEEFRAAHAGAGQGPVLTLGPPVFEGFQVLQDIQA
ncbi:MULTISPECIES: antibiotic biosynthesis monooxygenase family protein [Gluconobacter]|uniref:Antibiotic biosynthesis monooxygenase n=2 Tax=Gluconobacter oxydans TaxID=442 RepID=A0A149S2G3_GLUOY|nr:MULTISPECIES: antibiotic biosynthesis monooxygenase [Gluconobacter]KXV20773.1 antibiotic biosynthesis monooxygenase [Gluconobacter oxydans]KXV35114.1 antibiotic biosynthesis monooxygenase [Gluconobacter oxydans]KXV65916.1 antibiotic biosynthesis monooxygenase [Gluconobacter oxydans]MBF0856433.1 antibiotic biosynthesis monooxygenase [Gluconobacter oxydans]TCW26027.1 heme-degrading monooxygenase HmoA [Gluconobacter oxydans]